jgi:hypothetical protein
MYFKSSNGNYYAKFIKQNILQNHEEDAARAKCIHLPTPDKPGNASEAKAHAAKSTDTENLPTKNANSEIKNEDASMLDSYGQKLEGIMGFAAPLNAKLALLNTE